MTNTITAWWRRRKHLKELRNQPTATVVFKGINGVARINFNTLPQAVDHAAYLLLHGASLISMGRVLHIEQGTAKYYRQDIYDMHNAKAGREWNKAGVVSIDPKEIGPPVFTTLECPNCKWHFEIKSRYDENMGDPTHCPNCAFSVAKQFFEYVGERPVHKESEAGGEAEVP